MGYLEGRTSPNHIISRRLDTNGDGTGTTNAVGNYVTATDFFIKPAADEVYRIERMIVGLEDTVGMDANAYGNGIVLTNGIKIYVENDAGIQFYLTPEDGPIKTNGEWGHMCYDVSLLDWGSGNEHLVVRWTFSKSGRPIMLHGWTGAKLVVNLEDNFSGLVSHHFLVQGFEYGTQY